MSPDMSGMRVLRAASPQPKASLGAKGTPQPQPRQVLSFAPVPVRAEPVSPSPPDASEGDRRARPKAGGLSGAQNGARDGWDKASHERDGRHERANELRYPHRLVDSTGRSDEADLRASRHSEETIPEGAAWRSEETRPMVVPDERAVRESELLDLQEKLRLRERSVVDREADLVAREKRVADREADLAKMFDRLTEREAQYRKESQARSGDLTAKEEELRAQVRDLKQRHADLDHWEAKLKQDEERCRDLKRGLDERDARWQEASKDATVILKPHLKPRLSPRGKENVELQRQLEEQRGLMHKIKRKQDSWAPEGEEDGRCHRDSFGSEETVVGPF